MTALLHFHKYSLHMGFFFREPPNTYKQRMITLQWICYNDVFNIAILQGDLLLIRR
jgi:hypothetical protein